MKKKMDTDDSREINSRILLLILDELRAIRSRMDTALGVDGAPADTPGPQTPPLKVEEEAQKPAPDTDVQPPTETAEPKPPLNVDPYNLPTPKSPDEEIELLEDQKQRIDNMISLARFTEAEKLAQALLAAIPANADAEALLETARSKSSASRIEQQTRLFAEFQQWTESRQWIKARTVGEQLIDQHPASEEGLQVAAAMSTVEKNAHFEEARTLRDRVRDMIKRKRYSEAVEVAEDLIDRFPNTQVAKQLHSLLPDLKKRSALFR
jgi:tetratricopeptide (TPR) repeat protein